MTCEYNIYVMDHDWRFQRDGLAWVGVALSVSSLAAFFFVSVVLAVILAVSSGAIDILAIVTARQTRGFILGWLALGVALTIPILLFYFATSG